MKKSVLTGYIKSVDESELEVFDHDVFGSIALFVDEDGKAWFKLNEVCKAIGMSKSLKNKVLNHMQYGFDYVTLEIKFKEDVFSNTLFVSEGALYTFLLEGESKVCDVFRWWISEEVLPKVEAWKKFNLENISGFITSQVKSMQVALDNNDYDTVNKNADAIIAKTIEQANKDDKNMFKEELEEYKNANNPYMLVEQRIYGKKEIPSWLTDIVESDGIIEEYEDEYNDSYIIELLNGEFERKIKDGEY